MVVNSVVDSNGKTLNHRKISW